ncbi:MAG: OmpA family protein [Elusimicrobiaceae bacterium]|nr:OmpA family protein [Elusimicrobiaceae bacterium]
MKKVMTVLAAALFLGACHCAKCTTQTAGRFTNKPACQQCDEQHKSGCKCKRCKPGCKCHKCEHHKPAPVVVVAPVPVPPAPKVEEDKAIAEVANIKQAAHATVLSFKDPINFKYNSDELDAQSLATVDKVANALKNYPNAKIRVAGYTDSLGNPNYNMDLSERRAYSVAKQLVKDGVSADNVSYIGYGAANPVASNKTAEGRYQNRRVELEVTNN